MHGYYSVYFIGFIFINLSTLISSWNFDNDQDNKFYSYDSLYPNDYYEIDENEKFNIQSSNNDEIRRVLFKDYLKYKNKDHDNVNKRESNDYHPTENQPSSSIEWIKKSQNSMIAGTVASVALMMGIIMAIGIAVKKRKSNQEKAFFFNQNDSNKNTSPSNSLIGYEIEDKRLAHSAQMYHYQFQKQQILAMEKASNSIRNDVSEEEGTDVETDADFTVYECAGLAPTNDMEIKNPLFCGSKNLTDETNANENLIDDELLKINNISDISIDNKS